MESEIQNFICIWISAIASSCYCYFIPKHIPSGAARLLSLFPVILLFIALPFRLTVFHLAAPTIFYLVWLANFKLLLFAFDHGPLSGHHYPPLPLLHFVAISLLPIKPSQVNVSSSDPRNPSSFLFAVKALLLPLIVWLYKFRQYFNQNVVLAIYCCHIYLGVELVLFITAAPIRSVLGLELEPQFKEPYLATSLQDFWGRRWNLMVPNILRPTVYFPVRSLSAKILGKEWANLAAIVASFLVSGLMHELIYYYLSRARPTWEVTWFFLLHGVCVAAEVIVKKKVLVGGWRLNRAFSGPLTLGFVAVTGNMFFFPQILRNGLDVKIIDESFMLARFVRDHLPVY
nr:long-chain-alcohol O-fatty-acyltransferase-like [Ipomoea batatas]